VNEETERYPGEWENKARLAELDRKRRMGDGWHPGQWSDPAARSAELAERYADPAEVRQAAYDRTRARLNGAADVRDGFAALRSLGENLGLPIGGIGHEIGPS
jgi:hypothetical protein